MSRTSRVFPGKAIVCSIWIAACILVTAGCSGGKKAEPPPLPPSDHLAAGYTVTVEIIADGRWFRSGFEARPDDVIIIETVGEAQSLPHGTLLMHLGSATRPVNLKKSERVTERGEIALRAEPKKAGVLKNKPIRVKISNVRR